MTLIEKFKIPLIYKPFFEEHLEDQLKLLQKNIKEPFSPKSLNLFNFLTEVPPKVVIMGAEPYYSNNVATGLSFAVSNDNVYYPDELIVLEHQYNEYVDNGLFDKTFEHWKQQGILMMNASLTSEKGKPNSHHWLWRAFIQKLLRYINNDLGVEDFILLGGMAHSYYNYIEGNIIRSYHPNINEYNENLFKARWMKEILIDKLNLNI